MKYNAVLRLLQLHPADQEPHVILVLMQQLAIHGEGELMFLIDEMVRSADTIKISAAAVDILCSSLSLPSLDAEYVLRKLQVRHMQTLLKMPWCKIDVCGLC